jgi:plastocyanin
MGPVGRTIATGLATAYVLSAASCASSMATPEHVDAAAAKPRPPRPSAVVVLRDVSFRPARLAVRRGAIVAFAWRDGDIPHNVTPVGRMRFRTLATRKVGTARVRFARRGTFRFVCTIHPGMAGRVVVGDGPVVG